MGISKENEAFTDIFRDSLNHEFNTLMENCVGETDEERILSKLTEDGRSDKREIRIARSVVKEVIKHLDGYAGELKAKYKHLLKEKSINDYAYVANDEKLVAKLEKTRAGTVIDYLRNNTYRFERCKTICENLNPPHHKGKKGHEWPWVLVDLLDKKRAAKQLGMSVATLDRHIKALVEHKILKRFDKTESRGQMRVAVGYWSMASIGGKMPMPKPNYFHVPDDMTTYSTTRKKPNISAKHVTGSVGATRAEPTRIVPSDPVEVTRPKMARKNTSRN